ncbi:hypothetical protein SAMN05216497_101291 [Clostridium cochlearium]|uniref:Uncharacterized protein n=1 Tax=Clostridium cochlearium TaxID=1494 RepID=A0ABY0QIE5_CLOCO|nr:hypothetical protein SAMN05216497_101291 [Clostridium cochlearium]
MKDILSAGKSLVNMLESGLCTGFIYNVYKAG